MPQHDARETGFGTGLLAHIELREIRAASAVPDATTLAPASAEAAPAAEREVDAWAHDPEEPPAVVEAPPPAADPVRAAAPAHAAPVAAALRRRAAEELDRVWRVYIDALDATLADGRPDTATRLAAANALVALAEATNPAPVVPDELSEYRERRSRGVR